MRTTVRSAPSAFHSSEVRMELPVNAFKRALIERRQRIGLWCNLPGAYVAEALAGSGFDWMPFDTRRPVDLAGAISGGRTVYGLTCLAASQQRSRTNQTLPRYRRANPPDPLCSERGGGARSHSRDTLRTGRPRDLSRRSTQPVGPAVALFLWSAVVPPTENPSAYPNEGPGDIAVGGFCRPHG